MIHGVTDDPHRWSVAIDPGDVESGYAVIDIDTYEPVECGKIANASLKTKLFGWVLSGVHRVSIEMIASYGMPVGREVFETCVWIGRFIETCHRAGDCEPALFTRLTVRLHHCHSTKAKDSNVTRALVDRFTPGQPIFGKGSKTEPGWFYGFKADVWQAYALGVFHLDVIKGRAA
jgi:hypothetical protein